MAKQQIKTKVQTTSVLIVPAAEIEAMIRARYPHVPKQARMGANTDCGLIGDLLLDIRMEWDDSNGNTEEVDVPEDIARPTCGIPGCPVFGCPDVGDAPDPEPDDNDESHLPHPAERLGNTEFDDGF